MDEEPERGGPAKEIGEQGQHGGVGTGVGEVSRGLGMAMGRASRARGSAAGTTPACEDRRIAFPGASPPPQKIFRAGHADRPRAQAYFFAAPVVPLLLARQRTGRGRPVVCGGSRRAWRPRREGICEARPKPDPDSSLGASASAQHANTWGCDGRARAREIAGADRATDGLGAVGLGDGASVSLATSRGGLVDGCIGVGHGFLLGSGSPTAKESLGTRGVGGVDGCSCSTNRTSDLLICSS